MPTKLKPGDAPMTGAQAVAMMTSTSKPTKSQTIERKLLVLKDDLRRIEAQIDAILREVQHGTV